MKIPIRVAMLAGIVLAAAVARAQDYDVVVYGGTSGGVVAAVQAKRMGKSVVLVGPDKHLGGLTSGGLGWTDTGNKAVIGGLSREFYHRVWKAYNQAATWRWQKKDEYGNKGQGTPAIDGEQRTMWIFEPGVAESVFDAWVKELNIPVVRDEWLDRARGVKKSGGRITAITMLSGKTYTGKMFIDATYEGDLMAAAGVMVRRCRPRALPWGCCGRGQGGARGCGRPPGRRGEMPAVAARHGPPHCLPRRWLRLPPCLVPDR